MGKLMVLPIEVVRPNKVALRQVDRSNESYQGLVASIRNKGFIGTISVRERTDENTKETYYELVDGLHRYTAAAEVGLKEIPCDIVSLDDSQTLLAQIMMNIHKVETRPVDYTKQLIRILQANMLMTEAELASMLGKSTAWIADRLSLTNIKDEGIKDLVNTGKIVLSNAVALAKLPPEEHKDWLERAMTESPNVFMPAANNRVKAIREAKRQGKDPNAVNVFEPHARLQSLKTIKDEAGLGEDKNAAGRIARLLANDLNIPDKYRDQFCNGAQQILLWAIHMDAKSIEEQKAKEDARKADAERKKAEAKAAKAAEKAEAAKAEAAKVAGK